MISFLVALAPARETTSRALTNSPMNIYCRQSGYVVSRCCMMMWLMEIGGEDGVEVNLGGAVIGTLGGACRDDE